MSMTPRKFSDVKNMQDTADTVSTRAAEMAGTAKREINDMGHSIASSASDAVTTVSDKLKAVGVDTDAMATAAKDQATELQKMLSEELRARPLRALGIAAALGVVVGLMTAR